VDAKEVASLVGDWGFEVSGSSGSSLGALWELATVARIEKNNSERKPSKKKGK